MPQRYDTDLPLGLFLVAVVVICLGMALSLVGVVYGTFYDKTVGRVKRFWASLDDYERLREERDRNWS